MRSGGHGRLPLTSHCRSPGFVTWLELQYTPRSVPDGTDPYLRVAVKVPFSMPPMFIVPFIESRSTVPW
jgi:hypothetical protein